MPKKIYLLSCYNLYESKRYFTDKLAKALEGQGFEVSILSWSRGPMPEEILAKISKNPPDLTCSFHQLPAQTDGRYFWDTLKLPHWTILVDPAFYDLELMQSPYSIISCVDRGDCELLKSYRFENGFFFPHAVEHELIGSYEKESTRPYDVILLGTCYDPDNLRSFWQNKYTPEVCEALDDAVERVLSDNKTSFFRALLQALTFQMIDPRDVEFDRLAYYVDSYARGIDRLRLIQSIKNAKVHVFGGKCWREEKPIADWSHYLSRQANVTVHHPVPFSEALQLLKQSKICLNSMPFFKDGSHERVFAALACGSLPLTSDNIYMREKFTNAQDMLFYQSWNLDGVDELVQTYVKEDALRGNVVSAGQTKISTEHTWDIRVERALQDLQPILQRISELKK